MTSNNISKKVQNWINDCGLTATRHNVTAYAATGWDDEGEECYIIQYCANGFPPFQRDRFTTIADLCTAMREFSDLRRWSKTQYEE
jgi:hypothetical protein